MTDVVGGLRSRLLHDSLVEVLKVGLTALGWFDSGRSHYPLSVLQGPHHWDIPVTYNTLVITNQGRETDDEVELGSHLSTDSVMFTVDLYAQSDALGIELTNDMRDILRGRLTGANSAGLFPILDFRQPTPAPIGYATIATASVQRSIVQVPEEWARHVFTLSVIAEDTYY